MEIRRLTLDNVKDVLRLRDLAGWNQTELDIRRLLALEPDGCFAACVKDHVVGTATTTTYGTALAWIGMVLVEPAFRRQGIASALMEWALTYLRERQVENIKLDATPAGQHVYERVGFVSERMLERWSGIATRLDGDGATAGDWSLIAGADRLAFGTDRGGLLQAMIADSGRSPSVVRNAHGDILGFGLTRPGSRAEYAGPIVTSDVATARTLLGAMFEPLFGKPVLIDAPMDFAGACDLLREIGFTRQRELLRMRLGPNAAIGTSKQVFAIAGPEVG